MICDRCKKNDATIHLTEIIKEVKSEVHICEQCAGEIGLSTKISDFPKPFNDVVSFIDFQEDNNIVDSYICKNCGTTFFEYRKNGKLGCSKCYNELNEPVAPVINALLGDYVYNGKIPLYNISDEKSDIIEERQEIRLQIDFQKELEKAILEERYEDAAIYRDRMKRG